MINLLFWSARAMGLVGVFVVSTTAVQQAAAVEPPAEPPVEAPPAEPAAPDAEGGQEGAVEPPFEAVAPDGWKVIKQTAKTMVLALNDSPVPVPPGGPMMVITKSSKVFKDETVKRQSVIQFGDDLKRWTFKGRPKIDKIAVDGRAGYEGIRKGTSTADESKQRVYIGKVFLDDGNLVVLGYCPDDEDADARVEAFKALTRSLKSKP